MFKMCLKYVAAILLTCSFSIQAVTFPVTVNADAKVTFTKVGGSNTKAVTVSANEATDVTLDWITATTDVEVEITPTSNRVYDTLFTVSVPVNVSNDPAWDSSKEYQTAGAIVTHKGKTWKNAWWANPGDEPGVADVWKEVGGSGTAFDITVELESKPLPTDTAFVPVKANVATKLTAIPVQMIAGSLPSGNFVFDLEPNKVTTIELPVNTDQTSLNNAAMSKHSSVAMSKNSKGYALSIPSKFIGGSLNIYSISGKLIGTTDLFSKAGHSMSIWGIASGIYFVQVRNGSTQWNQKISFAGGDFFIAASITNQGDYNTVSNRVAFSRSGSTAQYRFEFDAVADNYTDTSFTKEITGQLNNQINVTMIDPDASSPVNIEDFFSRQQYNEIFKNRAGVGEVCSGPSSASSDFYTYDSFKEAIETIAKYKATVYTKPNSGGDKVTVEYRDGSTHTYYSVAGYEAASGTETSKIVEYSSFLKHSKAIEELVAYFSHVGSETTGGWASAPDGLFGYGLCFVHESGMNNSTTSSGYTQPSHSIYPSVSGKSYHGRGPKQLSWNYNYGQFSDFLYKDKSILLNSPNNVASDPVLAWMSSLWFWLTPQGAKPSCHMVMAETWEPTADDISRGRTISKFGQTTNIINGRVEQCGSGSSSPQDQKRIGHYNYFSDILNHIPEGELSCKDVASY